MIVDLGPAHDMPSLVLPHSRWCPPRSRPHPRSHCYRERELETRVIEHLEDRYPHIEISRQERWRGIGVPDIVTRFDLFGITAVTIIELKAAPATHHAYAQLRRYVKAATFHWAEESGHYAVMGVLGAFYIHNIPWPTRPEWLSRWWMDIEDAA